MILRVLLIPIFVLLLLNSQAQEPQPIQISSLHHFEEIDSLAFLYVDTSSSSEFLELPPSSFLSATEVSKQFVKSTYYTNYFNFSFHNDSKQDFNLSFFSAPGLNVRVCRINISGKIIEEIKSDRYITFPNTAKEIFSIVIPPDSVYHFTFKIPPIPIFNFKSIQLWAIPSNDKSTFFSVYTNSLRDHALVYMIIEGMLLMMLFYILALFIHVKKPEYGYYSAYIFFVIIFAALRASDILEVNEVLGWGKWYTYINDISQVFAYCMYFPFLRHYLNTKQNEPKLDRQLSIFSFALIGYVFVYWFFKWNDWRTISWYSWNLMRVLLIAMVIYLATKVWKMKQPYAFYPIIGGLSFTFLALLAMVFTIYDEWVRQFPYPLNYAVFYYFVGIIIELIFFSLGLGFKHRMDEVEKVEAQQALQFVEDRQEFERYKSMTEARETERSRIAKDLHDGIGGLLSGVKISLANIQSRLALKADDQLVFARSLDMLDGSVQELRRVAHAMMPPSLEVFGLKAALRDYVEAVNSMKTMKTIFQVMGDDYKLSNENELIIYRIVQELMNNILKHAQATECLIQLAYLSDQLSITVEDNGRGFDSKEEKKGMGWVNIRQRVQFLKGSLDLNTSEGNGTSVQINIPFG